MNPRFYQLQSELYNAWTTFPRADHRALAREIVGLATSEPKRILDLGAGGGTVAAAVCDMGYDVTAIDQDPGFCHYGLSALAVPIIPADFFTHDFQEPFDLIYAVNEVLASYGDADQRRLFRRIASWLAPDGCAVVHVLSPFYWARRSGFELVRGRAKLQHVFDPGWCAVRMTCSEENVPDRSELELLRCHAVTDFVLLLEGTGLVLDAVVPGEALGRPGGVFGIGAPRSNGHVVKRDSLLDCMRYLARLRRPDGD